MDTLRSWEETLKQFYQYYKVSPGFNLDAIVNMALQKTELPKNLDPNVREIVELVAEWEKYEWDQASTPHPFDVLVCRVRETIEVLISSLQWQSQVASVGVRNGADTSCVCARTTNGVELMMSRDVPEGARLVVSFPSSPPQRVELKKNGQWLDSVPVLANSVELTLPGPGMYELVLCHPESRYPLLALSLEAGETNE